MKTMHSPSCKRAYNRYDMSCPRCQELANGAEPRRWKYSRRHKLEQQRLAEIRAHDCKEYGCGPVCTAFDW